MHWRQSALVRGPSSLPYVLSVTPDPQRLVRDWQVESEAEVNLIALSRLVVIRNLRDRAGTA